MALKFWPAGYPANLKLDTDVTGYWNSGYFLYRQQIFFWKNNRTFAFSSICTKVSGLCFFGIRLAMTLYRMKKEHIFRQDIQPAGYLMYP